MSDYLDNQHNFLISLFTVLARVKSFLPEMQAAEKDLAKRMTKEPAQSFDIENVKEDEKHVEMVCIFPYFCPAIYARRCRVS